MAGNTRASCSKTQLGRFKGCVAHGGHAQRRREGMSPGTQAESGGTAPVQSVAPVLNDLAQTCRGLGSGPGHRVACRESGVYSPASFQATLAGDTRERVIFMVKAPMGDVSGTVAQRQFFRHSGRGLLRRSRLPENSELAGKCFRSGNRNDISLIRARAEPRRLLPLPPGRPHDSTTVARPPFTIAKPVPVAVPSAQVITEGKRVFLNLKWPWPGRSLRRKQTSGRLPGGTRLEITNHVRTLCGAR